MHFISDCIVCYLFKLLVELLLLAVIWSSLCFHEVQSGGYLPVAAFELTLCVLYCIASYTIYQSCRTYNVIKDHVATLVALDSADLTV